MDVSIIIVNYNTCALTRNCLKSVFEQTKDIEFEVIVSDNNSNDGSIEMIKQEFPQVILIENNANLGFGAANNRGLKLAKGKYIFYLNSDEKHEVIHSYGCFPRVWKEIIIMIRRIIVAYIKFFLKILGINYKKYSKPRIYSKYIGDVEYITGADLFVKNNNFAYYDERFFLYYEETHLQHQMMKNGLKRLIIDRIRIIHLEGGSDKKKEKEHNENTISFGTIQFDLSRIKYLKYNSSSFAAIVMQILLFLLWITPLFYNKTKKYRKEIWKI